MRPAAPPQRRQAFIAGDPLRAVAAVSVIAYHAAYFVAIASHRWFDSAYGGFAGGLLASLHLGLFVFFALSGYLISRPFVEAFLAAEKLPSLSSYLRKRLLRICPPFWAVLTVVLIGWGTMHASALQVVSIYGFAQNYTNPKISILMGQAWTLDVEIAFYVLVPLGALALATACRSFGARARRTALYAVLAGAAIASLAMRSRSAPLAGAAWETALPAMLFAFIPGVLLAAVETTGIPARLRRSGSPLAGRLALVFGTAVLAAFVMRGQAVTPQFLDPLGAALAASGAGLLVAAALLTQWSYGQAWRLLDNRLMRWVGERSYSLYLVHQPIVVSLAFGVGVSLSASAALALTLASALLLSLLAASVLYRYVEAPFLHAHFSRRRWRALPELQSS